jgi:hypothetical protein
MLSCAHIKQITCLDGFGRVRSTDGTKVVEAVVNVASWLRNSADSTARGGTLLLKLIGVLTD